MKPSASTAAIVNGVRWTYFSAILSGTLQIVLLAIMARLVEPSDFGILTTSLLVIKASQVLVQSGYERAVVWTESPTDACLAGLFWLSIATGVLIAIGVANLAEPLSEFFQANKLHDALVALSPMAILVAPGLVSRGLMRRAMRFRAMAIYEVISYAIGFLIVGLPLALSGWGLWALVVANLVQCSLQGIIPLFLMAHPVFSRFSLHDIAPSVKFSYSVSGLGILEFVDTQSTQVLIGQNFGMSALGVYNRSFALIQLPIEQIGGALTRVLFSPFNRARGNPERLRQAACFPLALLSIIVFPVAFGGAAASRTVIDVMLGSGWDQAVPIFVALCFGSAAAVVGNLLATMNEALSLLRQKLVAQLLVTALLIGLQVTVGSQSLPFAALCFGSSRVFFLFAQIWIAAPYLDMGRLRLALTILPGIVVGMLTGCMVFALENASWFSHNSAWARLPILMITAGLCAMALALIALPELRRAVLGRLLKLP
jgi:lipopolysaccharide exporter